MNTVVSRRALPMAKDADILLKDFLALSDDAREQFLRIRTSDQQMDILDAWAKSDDFRLTDAMILPEPFRQMVVDLVAGSQPKGIQPLGRMFWIAPRYKSDSVVVENGTRRNQRVHIKIAKPTLVPSGQACHLLLGYGPAASIDLNKNRLVEIDAEKDWAPEPIPAVLKEVFGLSEEPAESKAKK